MVGGVFVLGLLLTPLGLRLGRKRLAANLAAALADPKSTWFRFFAFLAVVSLVNALIASQMTIRVVHGMESKQFCGSCHVMTPESRAFSEGPHASILCVDCHVGDGTLGLVESKVQGTRQLWSVITDTVHHPIAGAIEAGKMIPSAQTCERCHWKENPAAANLKLIRRYAEDEKNTPQTTLLTMNVGGELMGGIHGSHHGEGIEIKFVATDAKRQDIPLVEYANKKTGVSRTYVKSGANASDFASAPRITMQCFDCHNRPAHAFQLPDAAVDRALMLGRMSIGLPFLKKTSVEILKAAYATSEDAASQIPQKLASFYASEHPDVSRERSAQITEAGATLADIYSRNVFPELGVTWGTYPDNRGHQGFPGCFRCHGGEHTAASGEKITDDCFRCHHPVAVDEAKSEVLDALGVDKLLEGIQQK